MRSWTIAFSVGIFGGGFLPAVPPLALILALLLGGILLHLTPLSRASGAFCVGAAWLMLYAHHSLDERWPAELEAEDVWVEGRVWSPPQETARSVRFEFMIERICTSALRACEFGTLPQVRKKVLLNVYQALELRPGQRWRFYLRLRRPHGFANPGGFDYEAWLMQNRLRATGYVREHPGNALLAENAGGRVFARIRTALASRLEEAAPGLRYPHLILALTIGTNQGISESEWELFNATGTNHLIVISGLHVALAAFVLYKLGWWLATRSATLVLRWPAPQVAAGFALLGAWLYAGLAGFSLPVQRALVMAAVLLLGKLLRRQTSALDSLCLALALILLLDPLAPQNAGFWLSYCAVAVLLLLAVPGSRGGGDEASWLRRGLYELRTQAFLFAGLLPVMLVFFQQASLAAPLVNLPAIPYVGFLVVPLCLVAMPVLWLWPAASLPLLALCDALLHAYMEALRWYVDVSPLQLVTLPAPATPALLLLCALTAFAMLTRQGKTRLAALALAPACLLWPQPKLQERNLRFTVLDVGQGLAVALSTRNHHLLYDAGPYFSTRFDAGSDVVVPYLRHMNIRALDMVILSHGDSDHAGGLAGVAEHHPHARYLAPALDLLPAQLDAETCRAGQRWTWDGVDFELLHPDADSYGSNDGSCVLRISTGEHSVLLPGDIERGVEYRLLRRGLVTATTVVVAPHHGSRTSSSPLFTARLAPEAVVFSSGYRNRFNHPAPEVQARYAALGARALLTSESGAIAFELGPGGLVKLGEWRRERPRFWAWPPPPEPEQKR